jgi:LacI family transcriptional regulator
MALGCLDALADAGLECPGDVSVVGYNDMPFADRFAPPLTTVTIAPYDLGARGATRLLEQLRGGDLDPVVELLTPRLIVRGSTGPAPRRRRTKRT